MSKNILLLVLWFVATMPVFAQPSQWQKTQVDDSVAVQFPGAPTKQELAKDVVYFVRSEQAAFIAVAKQNAFRPDAAAGELRDFYNGTLKGMLEAGGGGKIVSQQEVDLNGFPAMRAHLALNKNSKITGPYFNQIVLINGTCYTQSVLLPGAASPALLADKDQFFTSFATTKHRVKPGDPKTHAPGYQVGQLLGTVVFYGGLGALVLFFLRRRKKGSQAG